MTKYQQICEAIQRGITSGQYPEGQRLPSEAELGRQYGASRLTVNRALRELQIVGLIERREGSGRYVCVAVERGYTFGLLIPELGRTEIFEPICRGMAEVDLPKPHVLLWGKSPSHSHDIEHHAHDSCAQWIAKQVSGVFFAPLEYTPHKDMVNHGILDRLAQAGIPVVLIDRDVVPYPQRSVHDVVGIDNRRAAYVLTHHLIDCGCRSLLFLGRPNGAPSCIARSHGFHEAVLDAGLSPLGIVQYVDPLDAAALRQVLGGRPTDGVVCSNDFMAAHVMRALDNLGRRVPDDVRVAGFDDVKYASLLPVPLTSIQQPCARIGEAAIRAMMARLIHPSLPARDLLLSFQLIIRASTAGC